ncbi:MAG: hypothetical protein BroJett040_22670 [Oligoflexia bacterium]|nr:MAG: hypothetical protein BroJett040_22670 [Oligoflexia bacterium]
MKKLTRRDFVKNSMAASIFAGLVARVEKSYSQIGYFAFFKKQSIAMTAETWICSFSNYGGSSYRSNACDADGNIYVVGSVPVNGNDVCLTKLNKYGVLQWQRSLGSVTQTDYGYCVALDSVGNIYLGGMAFVGGNSDYLLIKYNSSGTFQWYRTLGGAGGESICSICIDASNNILCVGATGSAGAGSTDGFIVKYNSAGSVLWQYAYGGTAGDGFNCMAMSSTGNLYICGSTSSKGAGGSDGLIAKFDSNFNVIWARTLGLSTTDMLKSVAVDSSENIVVVGETIVSSTTNMLIAKYNSSGALLWQRGFGGDGGTERCTSVAVDSFGDIYIAGYTEYVYLNNWDVIVAKFSADGVLQWQRAISTGSADMLPTITIDLDGYMVISMSTGTVLRLPTDGSKTGTYGSLTYSTTTFSATATSLTSTANTFTRTTTSLAPSSATLADSSLSPTSTLIPVP